MEVDLEALDSSACYTLLAGLVVPRPIAWISTVNDAGVVNIAPFSFFNLFGSNPPVVVVAPGDRPNGAPKDTAANIRKTGEFVVNLVDESVLEAMNATAAPLPPEQSELTRAELTMLPCAKVRAPRIAEAPASLECVEHTTLQIGGNRLVVGRVLYVHVKSEILAQGERLAIDPHKFAAVARMQSPSWYARTRELFSLERPQS